MGKMSSDQKDKYAKIFTHPALQIVDVDRRIAAKAAVIRERYDTRIFGKNGAVLSGSFMVLADSLHVATALQVGVREMNTLDGAGRKPRRLDILSLNGNVNGARLPILKPCFVPPLPHLGGPVPSATADQGAQMKLLEFQDGTQKDLTAPATIPGSPAGLTEGKAGAEAEEETSKGSETETPVGSKEMITEGQPIASAATAADGSIKAPPSPTPEAQVSAPEQTALGGSEQKLGQQAPPPSNGPATGN